MIRRATSSGYNLLFGRRKQSTESSISTKEEPSKPVPFRWEHLRPRNIVAEIEKEDKPQFFKKLAKEMEKHFIEDRKFRKEPMQFSKPLSPLEVEWAREFVTMVSDEQGKFLVINNAKPNVIGDSAGCFENVLIEFRVNHPDTSNFVSQTSNFV